MILKVAIAMAGKTGNILALYDVLYRCTDEDHPLTMREIQDEMVEMGYNCGERHDSQTYEPFKRMARRS